MAPVRVLVVDDHPQVLAMVVRLLRELGGAVVGTGSAACAISALDAGAFDLLLADHALGEGRSGLDVLRHAAATQPACHRALFSGSHSAESNAAALSGLVETTLSKPIGFPELAALIERARRPAL